MSMTFSDVMGADCLQKIRVKYDQFLDILNDPQKPMVQIFSPLDKEAKDQIELVRDVSKYLQKKKELEVNAAEAKRVEETKTVVTVAETPKEQ